MLPDSVSGNTQVTLTAVRDDPAYTEYGMNMAGTDNPVTEFASDTVSTYVTASDFREASSSERTAEIVLKKNDDPLDDVTYTIAVTV